MMQDLKLEDIEDLEDIRGLKFNELTIHQKSKLMVVVLGKYNYRYTDLATKIIALLKPGHVCSAETCHHTCQYHLKGKAFDLLWAYLGVH